MAVTLVPIALDELTGWLAREQAAYIDERVASGQGRLDAVRTADEQLGRLFPAGKPAPGQYVFWILGDDEERVGSIWIGEAIGAPADSW